MTSKSARYVAAALASFGLAVVLGLPVGLLAYAGYLSTLSAHLIAFVGGFAIGHYATIPMFGWASEGD